MEVEVIYPYEPQQDDELRLQVGDIISNVNSLEKGWCKGTLNSESGVFPDNFVRLLTQSRKRALQQGNEMRPPAATVEKREVEGRRCRVVFSYTPQHEDELTLCEGEVIDILQEVEEGWWKGTLKGKVGMFPSNFVEEIEQVDGSSSNIYSSEPKNTNKMNGNIQDSVADPLSTEKNPDMNGTSGILASANSAFHPVQRETIATALDEVEGAVKSTLRANGYDNSLKTSKMHANNLEKERLDAFSETDKITINIGERKLKNVNKSQPTTPKQVAAPPLATPPQLPPKPVRELARALYPYTAEHDDELELMEGDIISILGKDLEDKGWWRGEINGKVGVFPDNFVKIINADDTPKPPRPEKRPTVTPGLIPPPSTSPTPSSLSLTTKEKETVAPPPLPSKKLHPPPPPTEKKPLPSATDEAATPKITHDAVSSEQTSLTLTRETHLTHMTRPKGPSNRRPPSQFMREAKSTSSLNDGEPNSEEEDSPPLVELNSEDKSDSAVVPNGPDDAGAISPSTLEANHPPWLKELRENQKKRLSGFLGQGEAESAVSQGSSAPTPLPPSSTSSLSKPAPPATVKPSPPPYSSKPVGGPNPIPQAREDLKVDRGRKSPSIPQAREDLKVDRGRKSPSIPQAREDLKVDRGRKSPSTPHTAHPTSAPTLVNHLSTTPSPRAHEQMTKKGPDNCDSNEVLEAKSLTEKVEMLCREVLPKIRSLESRLEEQHVIYARQIKQLTKDLDDERKQRACLQIEVDRLKKLLTTGYAQV